MSSKGGNGGSVGGCNGGSGKAGGGAQSGVGGGKAGGGLPPAKIHLRKRKYSSSSKTKCCVVRNLKRRSMADSSGKDDIPTFNAENILNNTRIINYRFAHYLTISRTFMSIIGGVIAGILGFTSLTGFIFYFLVMAITSAGLAAKTGFSVHSYFDSWNRIILDGILGGLLVCLSFIYSWYCLTPKVRIPSRSILLSIVIHISSI
ncbi:hypothetical protein BUALT_Bualt05G0117100 [Buddleja alternifolia]|uniref:ER membrane protein complex subunit 6 n=1 Tax=Buddleja alternifolia TaxID=168488 RepID=A0AAV6XRX5_9LAMI|nr:hypothetical protein BUALT_Bualt05G0117100 [Buddleja alternifolia]